MTLHVADGLDLSIDLVTKTTGILAQRRKGKSYTAAVIAEEFVDAGIPFVILDPTGAHWGLRASADGTKPGLQDITGADIARARLICDAAPALLRGVVHLYIQSGATVDEFLAYMHAELTDPQDG